MSLKSSTDLRIKNNIHPTPCETSHTKRCRCQCRGAFHGLRVRDLSLREYIKLYRDLEAEECSSCTKTCTCKTHTAASSLHASEKKESQHSARRSHPAKRVLQEHTHHHESGRAE